MKAYERPVLLLHASLTLYCMQVNDWLHTPLSLCLGQEDLTTPEPICIFEENPLAVVGIEPRILRC